MCLSYAENLIFMVLLTDNPQLLLKSLSWSEMMVHFRNFADNISVLHHFLDKLYCICIKINEFLKTKMQLYSLSESRLALIIAIDTEKKSNCNKVHCDQLRAYCCRKCRKKCVARDFISSACLANNTF